MFGNSPEQGGTSGGDHGGPGTIGYELVKWLVERDERVTISNLYGTKNRYEENRHIVNWNPDSQQIVPTIGGVDGNVPVIHLLHELAHAEDELKGTSNNTLWMKAGEEYADAFGDMHTVETNVKGNEIYATTVENQFRQERGYAMRTYYLTDGDSRIGFGPRLVDHKGNIILRDRYKHE